MEIVGRVPKWSLEMRDLLKFTRLEKFAASFATGLNFFTFPLQSSETNTAQRQLSLAAPSRGSIFIRFIRFPQHFNDVFEVGSASAPTESDQCWEPKYVMFVML